MWVASHLPKHVFFLKHVTDALWGRLLEKNVVDGEVFLVPSCPQNRVVWRLPGVIHCKDQGYTLCTKGSHTRGLQELFLHGNKNRSWCGMDLGERRCTWPERCEGWAACRKSLFRSGWRGSDCQWAQVLWALWACALCCGWTEGFTSRGNKSATILNTDFLWNNGCVSSGCCLALVLLWQELRRADRARDWGEINLEGSFP